MFAALALAVSVASCPIEHARYELRGSSGVTARFLGVQRTPDWRSSVALRVHAGKSGRSCWFLPWQGGTDQRTNVAWVRERTSPPIGKQPDRRDIAMFTTDVSYNVQAEVPKAGDAAPAHLLLPDLGPLVWYSTTNESRDSLARAFFDLTTCREPSRTEPAPQIEFPAVA